MNALTAPLGDSLHSTFVRRRRSRLQPPRPVDVDATGLAAALRRQVRGEVRFDGGSRALYATAGSNYRQVPIGVVLPRDADDVIATVAECRRFGAPILPRGGGTSLAGQCCNVAVILDTSKYMHRLIEIDPQRTLARVQPGVILDALRTAAEQHHLTFAPDPATHNHCTLGGMIGNNSCGVHSVMAGRTADNVEELDILTYDGTRFRVGRTGEMDLQRILRAGGRRAAIYRGLVALRDRVAPLVRERYPRIPRRVSGYNLDELLPENGFQVARALVGTEGTCVTVLEATLRLVHSPPQRSLLVLGYPDVYSAADHIEEVMAAQPTACEGLDDRLIEDMKKKGLHPQDVTILPPGNGWLVVEFGGESKQEADDQAHALMDKLQKTRQPPSMKLFDDEQEEKMVWEVRESGLGATAFVPGAAPTWEGWEDSAVPPARLGNYLRDLRALLEKHGYRCDLYGHFGQGCVHTRIDFDLFTAAGVAHYRAFIDAASDLVVRYGGSLSGEHGDGQSRAEFLPKMFGHELVDAFREFKTIWDPDGKMNPHKVVDPYRITDNLRLGPGYNPPQPRTQFQFPEDDHSFAHAALRCVGVGKCRRVDGGTMCPSYMVTREEMYSTRGRARLLFEMLQGQAITRGWRDPHVKAALDLCLACKGCKGECPVNVDMATYKAEFLSHYYARRLRPRAAYALGLISWWARLAAPLPQVANFVTHAPGLRVLAKALAGMPQARDIPRFAAHTFTQWFACRPPRNPGKPPVLLWPDTFNNHFHPETAQAAVEVLEAAGFQVIVPRRALCCGRPLYDYGMLSLARHLLRRILRDLRPQIAAGVPLVGLEPSCLAVFRDELLGLFPHDQDARRLAQQSFLLSEFLEKKAPHFRPPPLACKAVVHGHCHHKALMQMHAERSVLQKLGLDCEVLDSGCCGMAGSFGFERAHYDISMQVGERVLLPAVRAAAKDTLIIADGFSCRTQIAQATDRQALHLAQVLQLAMHAGVPAVPYPERQALHTTQPLRLAAPARTAALLLCGLFAVGGAVAMRARGRGG